MAKKAEKRFDIEEFRRLVRRKGKVEPWNKENLANFRDTGKETRWDS